MTLNVQDLVAEARRQILEIDAVAARERLAQGAITLIDVREPHEFAAGHVPGAINIPRGMLEFQLQDVEALRDRAAPVMVYCRSGGRAALCAVAFGRLGYSQVVSIAGGYEAWLAK